mmetsp:Transcript_826/g.3016  ORF Transcript_826/g.3016 Transcript_826/m.3016 type:complete len:266 (+) Transcript_826:728-1525(+)
MGSWAATRMESPSSGGAWTASVRTGLCKALTPRSRLAVTWTRASTITALKKRRRRTTGCSWSSSWCCLGRSSTIGSACMVPTVSVATRRRKETGSRPCMVSACWPCSGLFWATPSTSLPSLGGSTLWNSQLRKRTSSTRSLRTQPCTLSTSSSLCLLSWPPTSLLLLSLRSGQTCDPTSKKPRRSLSSTFPSSTRGGSLGSSHRWSLQCFSIGRSPSCLASALCGPSTSRKFQTTAVTTGGPRCSSSTTGTLPTCSAISTRSMAA